MESIVWFYLFWAAIASLAVAIVGLTVLALRLRQASRSDPDGKETYLSYAAPDYEKAAGFCVDCPHSELLAPTAYWLVDDRIAQIVYGLTPAQQITLRAALHSEEGLPCAEAYRDAAYDSEAMCEIDGVRVTLRQSNGGAACAAWDRDGVDYMLYGEGLQMNAIGGLLPDFVARTRVRREA